MIVGVILCLPLIFRIELDLSSQYLEFLKVLVLVGYADCIIVTILAVVFCFKKRISFFNTIILIIITIIIVVAFSSGYLPAQMPSDFHK